MLQCQVSPCKEGDDSSLPMSLIAELTSSELGSDKKQVQDEVCILTTGHFNEEYDFSLMYCISL